MVNYDKSIIYKLCCKDPQIKEIYVGSTTNFRRRKCNHKSDCYNKNSKLYNNNPYKFIRENGGFSNWDMIQVEKYIAQDRLDLLKRERYWFDYLGATLNMSIPNRPFKEYIVKYREENKEKINEKHREYYKNNKEVLDEKNREYYENNKEEIAKKRKVYREKNKEQLAKKSKERYENNKGEIAKKSKERYENNKEQYKERNRNSYHKNKEQTQCICGSIVLTKNYKKHCKTKKHNLYVKKDK